MPGKILLGQFEAVKDMIEQALEKGDERFNESVNDWSYNGSLFHIIEAIDFYMNYSPEGFNWGNVAGIDYENMNEEEIASKRKRITREMIREYLNKVWPVVREKVAKVKVDDLDDFGENFPVFDKYLFTLRHSVHHLGEIGKTLRDWKGERLKATFRV